MQLPWLLMVLHVLLQYLTRFCADSDEPDRKQRNPRRAIVDDDLDGQDADGAVLAVYGEQSSVSDNHLVKGDAQLDQLLQSLPSMGQKDRQKFTQDLLRVMQALKLFSAPVSFSADALSSEQKLTWRSVCRPGDDETNALRVRWAKGFEKQRQAKVDNMYLEDSATPQQHSASVSQAAETVTVPPQLTLLSTQDINARLAGKVQLQETLTLLDVLGSRTQTAPTQHAAHEIRIQIVRTLCKASNMDDWQAMVFVIIADFLVTEIEDPLPDLEKNRVRRFEQLKRRQLLLAVAGEPGSGKSLVINNVQRLSGFLRCRRMIRTIAPTGAAASVANGRVVDSLLGIRRGAMEKTQSDKRKQNFSDLRLALIDERSMFGCDLIGQTSDALQRETDGPADLPFGGVSVVMLGDSRQLQPVKDVSVFTPINEIIPDKKEREAAQRERARLQRERRAGQKPTGTAPKQMNDAKSPYLKAKNLRILHGLEIWKSFDKCIVLQQTHRYDSDEQLRDLVSAITLSAVTQRHVDFINSRVIRSDQSPGPGPTAAEFQDSVIVVSGNEVRAAFNIRKALEQAASKRVPMFVLLSKDTALFQSSDSGQLATRKAVKESAMVVDGKDEKQEQKRRGRPLKIVGSDILNATQWDELQNHLWRLPESAIKYMPGILPLFVGMPVQLKENIGPELGLFNGSIGEIVEIVFSQDEDVRSVAAGESHLLDQMIQYIVVRFPDAEHTTIEGLSEKLVIIEPAEETTYISKKTPMHIKKVQFSDKTHRMLQQIKRTTLHVVPAYAFTIWLVQGMTIKRPMLCDLRRPPRTGVDKWTQMLYVIVSRPQSWSQVGLLRPISLQDINTPWPSTLLAELERQNELHVATVPFAAKLAEKYGIVLSPAALAPPRPVRAVPSIPTASVTSHDLSHSAPQPPSAKPPNVPAMQPSAPAKHASVPVVRTVSFSSARGQEESVVPRQKWFPFVKWYYQTCGPDTMLCIFYPLWRQSQKDFVPLPLLANIMQQLQRELDANAHANSPPRTIRSRRMMYCVLRRRMMQSKIFGTSANEHLPMPSHTTDIAVDITRMLEVVDAKRDDKFDPALSLDDIDRPDYKEHKDCVAVPLPDGLPSRYAYDAQYLASFSISSIFRCLECTTQWRMNSVCLDVGSECLKRLEEMKESEAVPAGDTFIPRPELVSGVTISHLCQSAMRNLETPITCSQKTCHTRSTVQRIVWPTVLVVRFRQVMRDKWKAGSQVLAPALAAWDNLHITSPEGNKRYRLQSLVFHAFPTNHYAGEHLWPALGGYVWVHSDSMQSRQAGVCQIRNGSSPSWRRQFPPPDEANYTADRSAYVLLAVYRLA
jgi:hypothetical protein